MAFPFNHSCQTGFYIYMNHQYTDDLRNRFVNACLTMCYSAIYASSPLNTYFSRTISYSSYKIGALKGIYLYYLYVFFF